MRRLPKSNVPLDMGVYQKLFGKHNQTNNIYNSAISIKDFNQH